MSQYQTLREQLAQHFDKNGLLNLYFDLDIDPEEARNDRKSELVRYLVDTCRHQGRLSDLIDRCRARRPHVKWPDAIEDETPGPGPVPRSLPSLRGLLGRLFIAGFRGAAAGLLLTVVAAGLLMLVLGSGLSALTLAFAALAGVFAGLPLGLLLGLTELDGHNDWGRMSLLGALGGLIVGLVLSIPVSLLVPDTFLVLLLYGVAIGVCTAVVTWAARNAFQSLLPTEDMAHLANTAGHSRYLLGAGESMLAGALIGAFAGAIGGLLYELILAQDPLFGIVSTIEVAPSITGSLTLTGAGVLFGAAFLTMYRLLAKRLLPAPITSPKIRQGALLLLTFAGMTVLAIAIRPLGHAVMVQQSEKPYVAREYVGRIVNADGHPVNGVGVTLILEGIPIETDTDGNGVYRFEVTAHEGPLSGRIVVNSRFYGSTEQAITLLPDTTTLEDIRLGPPALPTLVP